MNTIIGRSEEQKILNRLLASGRPELIAVYGRRRVGKTYLIRALFKKEMVFEMSGIHDAALTDQLRNFSIALGKAIASPAPLAPPDNWIQAFAYLDQYLLDLLDGSRPAVLFFDEFPWIHTPRSNFLQAFDHWWNSSATKRPNLKVIICGSAASWMIDKIINNKSGLHNRVTQRIRLLPFTLGETRAYLHYLGAALDPYQLLQLYMAVGGIPYYLQTVLPGESAVQIIDRLCFDKDGVLRKEFDNLYQSLFVNAQQHEKVVRALSQKGKGLTRDEIIATCGLTSGGTTSKLLRELEESGFITPYVPFGKNTNDSIYKLSDEYSMFYLKFIEGAKATGSGSWLRKGHTPAYKSWSGFAFEAVCLKHVAQVKKALGIEGVFTEASGWRYQPLKGNAEKGTQIDLLIDRQDHCINICEMKFSEDVFVIDKNYAGDLDHKVNTFRRITRTRKTLFLTLITTYGVQPNVHTTGRVMAEVTMDALFL
ncbi:ATP-binding protein [Niabella pedocola]|uniref:ATP-binding protein n=1 Tax=Niabella pedocola TaxID=1752077 RepID=A0ABS8PQK1_9BACT|nr:ATP-binding protein [Niabella pedocola]MCD2423115.1 ATP-binding protein [Niabella pedocola]